MASEQQFRTAADRCLSVLRRFRDGEQTGATKARMMAEIEVIIGWLMELDLPPGVANSRILRPVELLLLAEFGREEGRRLYKEFVEVFRGAGMPLIFDGKYINRYIYYEIIKLNFH